MGKVNKRQKRQHTNHHDNPDRKRNTVVRRQHSQRSAPGKGKSAAGPAHSGNANQHHHSNTPFTRWDRVLLVGEGDFTFTRALIRTCEIADVTTTCFDSKEVLEEKYPDVSNTIHSIHPTNAQREKVAAKKDKSKCENGENGTDSDWNGFSPASPHESESDHSDVFEADKQTTVSLHYGIDATKLSSAHKKLLRPYLPFTKIVFNFPHVGGLSTDVNRQVRSNQQLLVGFFNAAKPLLASTTSPVTFSTPPSDPYKHDDNSENDNDHDSRPEAPSTITTGQILVTVFEGEPYTLWNIRDLARHSGLKVLESFRFPWSAYPGYQHARTIGDITSGKDRSEEGKRKGAWRGEERDARCYVLALKDAEGIYPKPGRSRKRKAEGEDD